MAKATKKVLPVKEQKRLLLLDSNAIAHRAYHAIPDLETSRGEPTGALYGIATMLVKAMQELKPDYIIATRDRAEKTHRHELFEDYKGTRAKTDDALIDQLKRMPEVFDAFGIPVVDAARFEADDVIGTLSHQGKKHPDVKIVILTGDMDMLQLIEDGRVTVFRLMTGINDIKFFDEEAVKERYGFGPEHITDYKGIRGDPSDNIPGVPGVGDGGATKLITTFGSIDDIYKAIKKDGVDQVAKDAGIQKRYVQLVADNEEKARFSKQLATIHSEAPVTFELPDHPWRLADHIVGIEKMCEKLEFNSLKTRVHSLLGKTDPKKEAPEELEPVRVEHAPVDDTELAETSLALWLLRSDLTTPTLDQILDYTEEKDFTKAREKIFAELKKTGRIQEVYDRIERPLLPVVQRMNADGVAVDVSHLKALSKEYGKELKAIASRIYHHAGHEFNINSPKQLGVVLFDELGITPEKQKKTATGARTTKESELEKLSDSHPIIGDILAHRELQKLLSTYIEKIPALVSKDGRLRAEFLQAGTTTGRMGSQNPNLQNIPIKSEYGRRIREAFAAPKGKIMAAIDYSQIELRLAAGLSGDAKLIEVFKAGGDVHTAVAAEVFRVPPEKVDREMRRRAKVINFGILYGMGVNALRVTLGPTVSREEAATYLEQYFKNFAGVKEYIEKTKREAARLGYTETLFGRRRYFSGFKSAMPQLRAQAERMATNAPIQGTQSDIIKLAMVEVDQLIEKKNWRDPSTDSGQAKVKLVLQVHDELVYEVDAKLVDEALPQIRGIMEKVAPIEKLHGVPILAEASVGQNWGYLTKLER